MCLGPLILGYASPALPHKQNIVRHVREDIQVLEAIVEEELTPQSGQSHVILLAVSEERLRPSSLLPDRESQERLTLQRGAKGFANECRTQDAHDACTDAPLTA